MRYLSCEWIEGRLVLERATLNFCCIPHSHGTKGYVQISEYRGGPLPAAEILRARRELIEKNNREGCDSPCRGCHFLREDDWEQPHDGALVRQIEVGNFTLCNLRCVYCYTVLQENGDLPKLGYPLLPLFREMIEKGYFEKGSMIEWGGGEPTILKDFAAATRLLMDHGMIQNVMTNAVRHSKEIEEGLRKGLLSIGVSVDSGTRETYARIKGRDRFDVVWRNLKTYAATGGEVRVKYIIRKGNSDAENITRFVNQCRDNAIPVMCAAPDMHEIAGDCFSEESVFAFALMKHEAAKNCIELEIRREYLDDASMARIERYVPVSRRRWRYRCYRAREFVSKRWRRIAGLWARTLPTWRRILGRRTTRRAMKAIEECMESKSYDEGTVAAVLEHSIRCPDRRLRTLLTTLADRDDFPWKQKLGGRLTGLGITSDHWSLEGVPCYLVVDASGLDSPWEQELWMKCYAEASAMPIRVTITDGIHDDIVYTFHRPGQARVTLPGIAGGRRGMFVLRTDKGWMPKEGDDRRRLCVQVATSP